MTKAEALRRAAIQADQFERSGEMMNTKELDELMAIEDPTEKESVEEWATAFQTELESHGFLIIDPQTGSIAQ